MRIIAKATLREFWARHPQSEEPLKAWHAIVGAARWQGPTDMKAMFRSADSVGDNRVIFNIAGNKYRLTAHIAYRHQRVLIKFVGTHAEYDRIDPETV